MCTGDWAGPEGVDEGLREAVSSLVSSGSATSAEAEEEALLLLVRQRNLEKQHSNQTFEGVGVGVEALPPLGDDRIRGEVRSDSDEDMDQTLSSTPASTGEVLPAHLLTWSRAITETMVAFQFLGKHKNKELGTDRSISLVLMRPEPVQMPASEICKCVRCSWPQDDDTPDLLFVSWLNNTQAHGLLGMKARQVDLDSSNKVLFSVPDTTMIKTGYSKGCGHPELICDTSHCDVLVPYVGAAMRKVTKSSTDRDQVPQEVLRLRSFCEAMVASFANPIAASSSTSASSCSRGFSQVLGVGGWSRAGRAVSESV